jgi:hypothetical protein
MRPPEEATMLAFVVTLSLLSAGQAKLADPAEDPDARAQAAPPAETPPAPPVAQEPAAPAQPPADAPAAATPPAQEAPAAGKPAEPQQREPFAPTSRQISLLSAETLHGGSSALAWVGWPSFGILWGQGISDQDDVGALAQYDWASTELLLGGWYRRALGHAGPFLLGGRFAVAWYANHEGTLVYEDNMASRGVQFAPSVLLSARGAGGIFSIAGDLPMTVTFRDDGGFLFQPRLTAAYEAPLYDQITVGIRGGVGYRVGSGDAPMPDGRADLELVLLAGYRIF